MPRHADLREESPGALADFHTGSYALSLVVNVRIHEPLEARHRTRVARVQVRVALLREAAERALDVFISSVVGDLQGPVVVPPFRGAAVVASRSSNFSASPLPWSWCRVSVLRVLDTSLQRWRVSWRRSCAWWLQSATQGHLLSVLDTSLRLACLQQDAIPWATVRH